MPVILILNELNSSCQFIFLVIKAKLRGLYRTPIISWNPFTTDPGGYQIETPVEGKNWVAKMKHVVLRQNIQQLFHERALDMRW